MSHPTENTIPLMADVRSLFLPLSLSLMPGKRLISIQGKPLRPIGYEQSPKLQREAACKVIEFVQAKRFSRKQATPATPVTPTMPTTPTTSPPSLRAEAPSFIPSPVKPTVSGLSSKISYINPEDHFRANNRGLVNTVCYFGNEKAAEKIDGDHNESSGSPTFSDKKTWADVAKSPKTPKSAAGIAVPRSFQSPQQKKQ